LTSQPIAVKKSHKGRNILITVAAIFLVFIIIGVAAASIVPTGTPVTFGEFVITGSDSNGYKVTFGVQSASSQFIAAPRTVNLVITSLLGVQMLNQVYQVTTGNFSNYQFVFSGGQFLGVSWFIPAHQFTSPTLVFSGTATITFTGSGGSSFSDTSSTVDLS
jgi:hypothetical protein